MRTRTMIAALISLPVNAVIFGAGAIAVLSIPALAEQAKYLLPAVIVGGFLVTFPRRLDPGASLAAPGSIIPKDSTTP